MAVGELFLSAFLQVLFDKLASPDLLNFVEKIKKWEKSLLMIQAVLSDAEEKQLTDIHVKMWLDDLQDMAYDVEDIVDEFAIEALGRKMMAAEHDTTGTSKVWNLIPFCFTSLSPIAVKFNVSMRSKLNDITRRLEEISKQKIELGLEMVAGATSTATWKRLPTEPAVCGRDEDKAKILEMVLMDEPTGANFSVIPIVGLGGVGKTALARLVYNDKAVEDFNPRVWVCVSDDFDVMRITKTILESITHL